MVAPILLYGSEITGFEKSDGLERLCTQFYKIILNLKKATPNIILHGELGRYPIDILVKSRMIGFWQRLINGKQDKIAYKLYKILLSMHERDLFHSKWLMTVKDCLNFTGFHNIWQLQENVPIGIAKLVKSKLIDNYKQEWLEAVFNSPKCLNYRIFKSEIVLEQYFNLLPYDLASALCHFRTLNHKLPVEHGRFWGVERDDRICELCSANRLGDEFHYLFECSYFVDQQKVYLPKDLLRCPNALSFEKLMNTKDLPALFKLSKFCKEILCTFKVIYS